MGALQGVLGAGVDDQGPVLFGQSAGQRQAQPTRSARYDRGAPRRFSGHFVCLLIFFEYNVSPPARPGNVRSDGFRPVPKYRLEGEVGSRGEKGWTSSPMEARRLWGPIPLGSE